jgi:hypothetical protein
MSVNASVFSVHCSTDKAVLVLLRELLRLEIDYRRRRGEAPAPEEYRLRFSDHASVVEGVFGEGAAPAQGEQVGRESGGPDPGPTILDRARLAEAGNLLAGRPEGRPALPGYEVGEVLGEGGMGVVYKARQVVLDRLVALKVIRPSWVADAAVRERFRAEARVVARFDHPNIVRVYDSGEQAGRPYFALELISGGSLAQACARRPYAPRAAAELVAQLADALDYAHRQGVVHRDLKPANVLLTAEGSPKVADFGLARLLDGAVGQTEPGRCLGTPAYMSPEQADGRPEGAGRATDVFGLGAILYELLTGRPPYQGETFEEVLGQARRAQAPPVREINPRAPAVLARACRKALAADPRQRHPSAAALAQDLRRYLGRGRRRAVLASVAGLALLAGALVWLLVLGGRRPAPEPLSGELIVELWSADGTSKPGLRVDHPGALPALPGEQFHVRVELNQPAHVYLLLLTSQGGITPLYPWNAERIEAEDVSAAPPVRPPRRVVHSPTAEGRNWRLDDKAGLETVLLLARRTPLPAEVRLAERIGQPPPAALRDPREWALRGGDGGEEVGLISRGAHRGIARDSAEVDDPLLRLMARLRADFEVIRAVRFAHAGK